MKEFNLIFYGKTEKELEKINKPERKVIIDKISQLKGNPRPTTSIKLIGNADYQRLRVGNYRVVYKIDDSKGEIFVISVKHRSEVYKRL